MTQLFACVFVISGIQLGGVGSCVLLPAVAMKAPWYSFYMCQICKLHYFFPRIC